MNRRRSLLQQVLLLILIVGIAACAQPSPPLQTSATPTIDPAHLTAFAQPQPTYPPVPTPTPALTPPPMGPVPHDCPPGPTPQPILSGLGPVVGSSPVWVAGFDGPHAVVYLDQAAFFDKHGWGQKMIWEVGPNYTHLVTLHGANLRSGAPIWFEFDGTPIASPVLDPQHPNHPGSNVGGDWAEWGSYVFVPAAGCYYLEARWPGGHWRITFAAGCCWSAVGEKVNPWGAEQKGIRA